MPLVPIGRRGENSEGCAKLDLYGSGGVRRLRKSRDLGAFLRVVVGEPTDRPRHETRVPADEVTQQPIQQALARITMGMSVDSVADASLDWEDSLIACHPLAGLGFAPPVSAS